MFFINDKKKWYFLIKNINNGCTAITSGRILVTDNVKHLERLRGVEIENWIASNTRE